MTDQPDKDNPVVRNHTFKNFKLDDDMRRQWERAKAMAPKNQFPKAGQLGQMLTDQIHQAQTAKTVDELPLMTQAEMLSMLMVCHQMLNESMRELTAVMAQVVELQKGASNE